MTKPNWRRGLIALVVLAAAAAAVAYHWSARENKQMPTYRFAKVERGPLTAARFVWRVHTRDVI